MLTGMWTAGGIDINMLAWILMTGLVPVLFGLRWADCARSGALAGTFHSGQERLQAGLVPATHRSPPACLELNPAGIQLLIVPETTGLTAECD